MNTCTSATASLPVQSRFITVSHDVPRLPLTSTGYSPIALIDVCGVPRRGNSADSRSAPHPRATSSCHPRTIDRTTVRSRFRHDGGSVALAH